MRPVRPTSSRAGRKALAEAGLVFTRPDGRPLVPWAVSKAFRDHSQAALLPPIPLHGLRHTYATLALASGVNPRIVSGRLGHATVALTLDVYSHVLPQADREAAERIAGLLSASERRRVTAQISLASADGEWVPGDISIARQSGYRGCHDDRHWQLMSVALDRSDGHGGAVASALRTPRQGPGRDGCAVASRVCLVATRC